MRRRGDLSAETCRNVLADRYCGRALHGWRHERARSRLLIVIGYLPEVEEDST